MTTKKHGRKRATQHSATVAIVEAPELTAEELEAQANSPAAKRAFDREQRAKTDRPVPTYTKDHEVAAARAMYGPDYEKLIASGAIVAPTHDDLPAAELNARIAKKDAKAEE
jgi:hypothetical protein